MHETMHSILVKHNILLKHNTDFKLVIPPWRSFFGMTYHLNSAPFLYLHHRHCKSQDIIFIRLLYSSPPGLPLKIKMSSLQTLLPWPISSFAFSIWTIPTLTATLSPPGILEIGPELLLTPLENPLWFVAALVNKLVRLAFKWRFKNLEITITITTYLIISHVSHRKIKSHNEFSTRIFIDIAKVFHTVDHYSLIHTLENLGVRGIAPQMVPNLSAWKTPTRCL